MKARLIAYILLALGLAACAEGAVEGNRAGQPAGEKPWTEQQAQTQGSLKDFLLYMRWIHADYEPSSTPAELAKRVEAVVTGTITDVSVGRSYAEAPGQSPESVTSVLKVKVKQLVSGNAALVSDGFVYIEVEHPASVGTSDDPADKRPFDHEAFAATVPRANGIFFLFDRTHRPIYPVILDGTAGRPVGAPLTSTAVQGFLIEDEGLLVSVKEPLDGMPLGWHELTSVDAVVASI